MATASKRRSLWLVFAYAAVLAAAALFFCSKSSPAYPLNDWSDANIYFSAGKGILQGKVMYRDLYDHKGPLLYALHALCALLSPSGFIGVYLLEILCGALFLTVSYGFIALYGGEKSAPLALPLLALMIYTSFSFQLGDSAEELTLPLCLFTLYDTLRYLKAEPKMSMPPLRLLLHGFLLGCVFWTKFTLCGLQGAALLCLLYSAGKGGWRSALTALGWMLLGFFLSTVPWLLYFGLNNGLEPWLKTYLYDNLFLYSSSEDAVGLVARLKLMLQSALDWVVQNPLYSIPTLLGILGQALRKKAAVRERLVWILCFCFSALGVFIAGRTYPYYPLALSAFAPAFFLWPCRRLSPWLAARSSRRFGLAAFACAVGIGLCPVLSPNVADNFAQPREETMQYQFAALINETPGATLLNYGFMDAGFYTAAGIAPSVKYYHQTNVPLQEMLDEQERYVTEAICDYVVTRDRQPDSITEHYTLIATADTPEGYWYDRVCLYRRKGL
ncbi:MAG: glycosyltransferase family 39 protein [Eubacteriales bacterium]|nr:glycosyltransferase family 39 protein [Eubacteriales bacterium]